jgi:HNH endonuclease/NUMOD4 motif
MGKPSPIAPSDTVVAGDTERWRPVLDVDGVFAAHFEVSDRGRVRRQGTGRLRRSHRNHAGYCRILLVIGTHRRTLSLHALVATAFLGQRPAGAVVHHANGIRDDNRATNLEYMTQQENSRAVHATGAGLGRRNHARGERHGHAKLTAALVRAIRDDLAQGMGQRALARRHGLHHRTIAAIAQGKTWRSVSVAPASTVPGEADPTECWRPLPGYVGRYEISDRGRSRRVATGAVAGPPGVGSLHNGYLSVRLRSADGHLRHHAMHRLVLAAFCGPCPPGHVGNHRDGQKLNNRLENLEWVTAQENNRHAHRLGLSQPARGAAQGNAKLTESAVQAILATLADGEPIATVAARYGLSYVHVNLLRHRRTWRHVIPPPDVVRRLAQRPRQTRKLAEADVRAICAALVVGERRPHIAARFGVSRPMVDAIAQGRVWPQVARPPGFAALRQPPKPRLTATQVAQIQAALARGESQRSIAVRAGVGQSTVERIARRRRRAP